MREQDYRPVEVIVVDDGSTDQTAETARLFSPPAQVLVKQHAGAGAARNAGAGAAQGSLPLFLDADDLWTPHALARLASVPADDPKLDLVCGQVIEFHHASDGRLLERPPVSDDVGSDPRAVSKLR